MQPALPTLCWAESRCLAGKTDVGVQMNAITMRGHADHRAVESDDDRPRKIVNENNPRSLQPLSEEDRPGNSGGRHHRGLNGVRFSAA
jgi:hypothetical protein